MTEKQPEKECGCTKTKYRTKHFNESVHRSTPQEELLELESK